MGLGKTVQALALILARPSANPARKATLILAPLALLKQWEQEIKTKVKPRYQLKTLILHGGSKSAMTVARMLTYDVVMTTYGTLVSEYKRLTQQKSKKLLLLDKDAIFHRIILDEAHNIKNRKAKASIAVTYLRATYRLCMVSNVPNHSSPIFRDSFQRRYYLQ
jgi:SNF2 family DNA or RNA helicase